MQSDTRLTVLADSRSSTIYVNGTQQVFLGEPVLGPLAGAREGDQNSEVSTG